MQKYLFCGIDANKNVFLFIMNSRIVLVLFILFALIGCDNNSISDDLDKYCNCKIELGKTTTREDCNKIIEEIVLKYEYDSEALVEIQQKLQECG